MESKDMILSDAIEVAIESEKKIIKLERAVVSLAGINLILIILLLFS